MDEVEKLSKELRQVGNYETALLKEGYADKNKRTHTIAWSM